MGAYRAGVFLTDGHGQVLPGGRLQVPGCAGPFGNLSPQQAISPSSAIEHECQRPDTVCANCSFDASN